MDVTFPIISDSPMKPKKAKPRRLVLNISESKYPVLRKVARALGWRVSTDEQDETNFDLWWQDGAVLPEKLQRMKHYQKVNHFPGMYALARKNYLARNISLMQKAFPKDYNFIPKTWNLPADYLTFRKEFVKRRFYIVKPEASCQGKGIFVTNKVEDIDGSESQIVQEYLKKPYLIDGLKFDFRIYVLVTGWSPLRIFQFKEGLTRFATKPYEKPTATNAKNQKMHLTNYAINKNSNAFIADENTGHKRSLTSTLQLLKDNGHNVKRLKNAIKQLTVKTICSVQPSLEHVYKSCQPDELSNSMWFEILGLDVMIDHKLKPYLLEVNHSPSFMTDSELDEKIKYELLYDSIQLLNINPRTRRSYNIAKQKETIIRTQTGRKVKVSTEQRLSQMADKSVKRDQFEARNLGNFSMLYNSENAWNYKAFLTEADRLWQIATGTKITKNRPVPKPEPLPVLQSPRRKQFQCKKTTSIELQTGEDGQMPSVFHRLANTTIYRTRHRTLSQGPKETYRTPSYFTTSNFEGVTDVGTLAELTQVVKANRDSLEQKQSESDTEARERSNTSLLVPLDKPKAATTISFGGSFLQVKVLDFH